MKSIVIGILIFLLSWRFVKAEEETSTISNKPTIEPGIVVITGSDMADIEEEDIQIKEIPLKEEPLYYRIDEEVPSEPLPVPEVPIIQPEVKSSNVITELKKSQKSLSSFSLSYGEYETLCYGFSHNSEPAKNLGFQFKILRERSDGFTWKDNGQFNRTGYDDFNGGAIYTFENWGINYNMGYYNHELTLPYQHTELNKTYRNFEFNYEIPQLSAESKLSCGLFVERGDMIFAQYPDNASLIDVADQAVGAKLEFIPSFKKGSPPIALGFKLYIEELKGKGDSNPANLETYSLYGQTNYIRWQPITFQLRLGWQSYKKEDSARSFFDGLLNIRYPTKKQNYSLFFSAQNSVLLPTFSSVYLKEEYVEFSNDLLPQQLFMVRLGGSYAFSPIISFNCTLFREQFKDIIIWVDENDNKLYEPFNINKACMQGIELGFNYTMTKHFSQIISLKFTEANNENPGGEIPEVPEGILQLGLNYEGDTQWKIQLDSEYHTTSYASLEEDSPELKSYFLLNAKAEKHVSDTVFFFAKWENMLNEDYEWRLNYPGQKSRISVGTGLNF